LIAKERYQKTAKAIENVPFDSLSELKEKVDD